jgi:hypothetical protein
VVPGGWRAGKRSGFFFLILFLFFFPGVKEIEKEKEPPLYRQARLYCPSL